MKYYHSEALNSTVGLAPKSPIRLDSSYVEISLEEYQEISGEKRATERPVKPAKPFKAIGEETPAVPVEVTPVTTQSLSDDEEDLLNMLLGNVADEAPEEDEDKLPAVIDSDVEAAEVQADSNIFESVRVMREKADQSKEARVVKGKSHGIYKFENEEWKRIGDL